MCSVLVLADGLKERGIFMCTVLVLGDGLKNEGYSFVARLFRLMD